MNMAISRSEFEEIADKVEGIKDRLDSLGNKIDQFLQAFPGEDVIGHRVYHELVIRKEQQREDIRKAVISKSLAGLMWGTLVFVLSAAWQGIKGNLHRFFNGS